MDTVVIQYNVFARGRIGPLDLPPTGQRNTEVMDISLQNIRKD